MLFHKYEVSRAVKSEFAVMRVLRKVAVSMPHIIVSFAVKELKV
jgi:hypothetical protein